MTRNRKPRLEFEQELHDLVLCWKLQRNTEIKRASDLATSRDQMIQATAMAETLNRASRELEALLDDL